MVIISINLTKLMKTRTQYLILCSRWKKVIQKGTTQEQFQLGKIHKAIGRPNTQKIKKIVANNQHPNCSISTTDIVAAEAIFGPEIGALKGKATRKESCIIFPIYAHTRTIQRYHISDWHNVHQCHTILNNNIKKYTIWLWAGNTWLNSQINLQCSKKKSQDIYTFRFSHHTYTWHWIVWTFWSMCNFAWSLIKHSVKQWACTRNRMLHQDHQRTHKISYTSLHFKNFLIFFLMKLYLHKFFGWMLSKPQM